MTTNSSPFSKLKAYPSAFWFANIMELCERAAYYGFFILITLYLSQVVGFSDIEAGIISGIFSGVLYLLPPFMGLLADRMGFRYALILAFALLTVGYAALGIWHEKTAVFFFLSVLVIGAAFIKPLISGTVAKTTTADNRAFGFSIFYWVVNIGAFSGKFFIPFIRENCLIERLVNGVNEGLLGGKLGAALNETSCGLQHINFFSAAVSALALLIAIFCYFPDDKNASDERKSFQSLMKSLLSLVLNARLMLLTLIIAGFWMVQQQLYATMPKYIIRMAGESARPEWIANVNPLAVVLFVFFVTRLMKRQSPLTSMTLGMFIMPLSALAMSFGPIFQRVWGDSILGLHPFTLTLVIGIAIQGLAECFISPRFLEYFSLQAPKGEEGIYLGFSHLHSFFSAILGFSISGFLLERYCPDPATLPAGLSEVERAAYYAQSHHIWYYFAAIAALSGVALLIYGKVYRKKTQAQQD